MNDLAKTLVDIAVDYLGPAGERFMARQLTHLAGGVTLATISREHLPELAKWVGISSVLLLDNKVKAEEFADKVRNV